MGLLYPVTATKFIFASGVLLCCLGWFSVLQQLQKSTSEQLGNRDTREAAANCPPPHPAQQQLQEWKQQSSRKLEPQYYSASASLKKPPTTLLSNQGTTKKRLRVLMGIFTHDGPKQFPYRRQFRKLFDVFPAHNDPRVCSLYEFTHFESNERRYQCQFIYTFVVGGRSVRNPLATTELVKATREVPFLLPADNVKRNIKTPDLQTYKDVTFLNIKENMNAGKSQTWFAYGASVLDQWDLDYVGKMDSDSLPYLDKFFHWAHVYLPPPPYNSGILAGVPIDKMWWSRNKRQIDLDKNEDFFKQAYGKILHLYAAGQCYILSRDLAHTVALESPKSMAYREGHEDHDISAMAFHSTRPISFHFLSLQQQFWRHPVKRYKNKVRYWRTLWHNENLRLKKVLQLRQEHLQKEASKQEQHQQPIDDDMVVPELAAPVQMELDDEPEGGGEEEEEEEEVGGDGEEGAAAGGGGDEEEVGGGGGGDEDEAGAGGDEDEAGAGGDEDETGGGGGGGNEDEDKAAAASGSGDEEAVVVEGKFDAAAAAAEAAEDH